MITLTIKEDELDRLIRWAEFVEGEMQIFDEYPEAKALYEKLIKVRDRRLKKEAKEKLGEANV